MLKRENIVPGTRVQLDIPWPGIKLIFHTSLTDMDPYKALQSPGVFQFQAIDHIRYKNGWLSFICAELDDQGNSTGLTGYLGWDVVRRCGKII